jgi:hypothetical protein
MDRELESGIRVRLHNLEHGYWYAELKEQYWSRWLLRLSSGYEFTLYV